MVGRFSAMDGRICASSLYRFLLLLDESGVGLPLYRYRRAMESTVYNDPHEWDLSDTRESISAAGREERTGQ